jgi:F0F1-type ATP synthase membrane subunit b/b'
MEGTVILIALLFNALTVLLVLFLVYKANKAIGDFEPYFQDIERMRGSIARRGNQILEKTISTAQEVIRNAMATSQKNISTSDKLRSDLDTMLKQGVQQNQSETKLMLQNATKDIVEAYQKQFSQLSKEIESAGLSAHRELMEAGKQRIAELSQGISNELAQVRQSAQEQVNKELLASQEKIKAYESQKINELDTKVYQIIGMIAKKTIGHAIDLSTHEELVLDALKKAKKENLL